MDTEFLVFWQYQGQLVGVYCIFSELSVPIHTVTKFIINPESLYLETHPKVSEKIYV